MRPGRAAALAAAYAVGCAALYAAIRAFAYVTLGLGLLLGTVPA